MDPNTQLYNSSNHRIQIEMKDGSKKDLIQGGVVTVGEIARLHPSLKEVEDESPNQKLGSKREFLE